LINDPFHRDREAHRLVVQAMGVKEGDQLAQIGCVDGGRMAALAAVVGPSGRTVAIVPDETSAARARTAAARASVPVDVEVAPLTQLPAGDTAFDLVSSTTPMACSPRSDQNGDAPSLVRFFASCARAVEWSRSPSKRERHHRRRAGANAATGLLRSHRRSEIRGFGSIRKRSASDGLAFVIALKPLT